MTTLREYAEKYSCARLSRDPDGILEIRLHTNDGPLVWNEPAHRELPSLWADVADDFDNRVIILTGTGISFCESMDSSTFRGFERGWDKVYWEGKRLLRNLLDIEVPIVAAINGPARIHSEIPLLSDVVICSDNTVFQDQAHFHRGTVPGDGVHLVWPELIGPNRGRYWLLTGQELSAMEALVLGVVSEVLTSEELLPRSRELARQIAGKPVLTLRYTRACLVQRWKRLMTEDLGYGLMLEGSARVQKR